MLVHVLPDVYWAVAVQLLAVLLLVAMVILLKVCGTTTLLSFGGIIFLLI